MKIKFLIGLIVLLIFSAAIFVGTFKFSKLSFKVEAFSYEEIPILVDDEAVIKKDNMLIPISLTTTRPISIHVAGQIRHIKIDHLSKENLLPIDIVFKDKTVRYFLQTLPEFFPNFSVNSYTQYNQGFVLISLHGLKLTDPSYSFILDMDGNIVFYRGHPEVNKSIFHLKKVTLPNGKVRYITHVQDGQGLDESYVVGYHLIMDDNFRIIDHVKVLKTSKHETLLADEHDILMLNDGHYILIGQDIIETTLPNGKKSLVTHTVIQEQKDGQVLWDWDSKEHPELQSACYEKCHELYSYNADYIHTNSLFIDPKDNHLLISSASGYYVMKLNRKTGEILWILGGKLNQFRMPQKAKFIRQHDIQKLTDGRLVMFDNHVSLLSPEENAHHHTSFNNSTARILILDLDETKKRVKSVQQIPLNFWARYMGSAQKLSDHRWFIGCGSSESCTARMIDTAGNILWDMKADAPYKMFRAYYYKSLK